MTKYVLFVGTDRQGQGSRAEMAKQARERLKDCGNRRVAIFDSSSGRPVDFELVEAAGSAPPVPRKPGRPKLGVVSKEISLLPRHWEWLGSQRGGASATLRRLVDAHRAANQAEHTQERAIEAAHRFIWDLAGDQPGFEEATRALFRKDFAGFEAGMAEWPQDVRDQALRFLAT